MSDYQFINSSQPVPDAKDLPINFSIKAPPSTDVWAKPPATHRFNAPILYKTLPLKSFKWARVSIVAEWKVLYDQGGLIIVINGQGDDEAQKRQWIKCGIEFTNNKPHISVVAKDRWADWSLAAVPSGGQAATIELVREEAENTLWVYLVEGVSRVPLREVTWAFDEEETAECWIGSYAARPSSSSTDDLVVDFRHLIVESC
jgi:regulation of enolase protein 1 (concanavalin A-like superfamily)